MLSRKTATALGLAGVVVLSTVTSTMASMPTAVAAIKSAPSTGTIDVRWGWWPGIGVGVGLGLLGPTIAAPYLLRLPYAYGHQGGYGYPYAYGCCSGYAYPYVG